ncbi:hypothetical protein POM88_043314 [Heracleum sosnowskyi]|uniref:Nucleolar protein 58/56 N-terminal domain-containing protein n=1 Tax=Heracleum sosnowskyi TaxID=360622 RepID=A0AAD8H395_9APIA|nr:hypothetical protein POM88_043314 [Heracleum sosnowskyi]
MDNVDEDFQTIKTSFNLLMGRKRRSEYDRYLRVTIDKENSKYKRTRKSSAESQKKVDDQIKREYRHLHHNIKELENKLKSKTSESSAEPQSFEDKLSIAMEKRSIRKGNENPSSDLANLNHPEGEHRSGTGKKIHLLFEFAHGYALFYAHNFNEVDVQKFESAEKYINPPSNLPSPLKLEAFHRFSSTEDALVEMNAISNSTMTEQLKSFLLKNLPEGINGKSNDFIATSSACLAHNMAYSTRFLFCSGGRYRDVMRALRMDIGKFIKDLHPGELGRKDDMLCTKNLVCGEALPSERLISVENEDGIKVEYRVWNPNKSKLAAAILCGVTNIWIKPGSRVLYLGDVRRITVFQLSDLVGLDGLVYVVGLHDNIVNIAEKRSNVITIFENPKLCWKYRMVVGMVDVIFADVAASNEVNHIVLNAEWYLETGGHCMIATQASNTNLTSQDLFAHHHKRREFKQSEQVTWESIKGAYVMTVGGFRMLEE